jgi:hypothetical protein
MSVEKTIRKVVDSDEQKMETYRYWQSQPIGDRLSAVWEVSKAAYSFAASFKGESSHAARQSERSITRIQRPIR